jgi:hypothetical protein
MDSNESSEILGAACLAAAWIVAAEAKRMHVSELAAVAELLAAMAQLPDAIRERLVEQIRRAS